MSGKTMLENKQITIGDRRYRLTIKKEIRYAYGTRNVYVCYLSDVDSQFTTNKIFKSLEELERDLRVWIVQSNMLNNPESRIFEKLKRWDGVIEL